MHDATIKKANFVSSIQYSRGGRGVRCFKYTNQSQTDSSPTTTAFNEINACECFKKSLLWIYSYR